MPYYVTTPIYYVNAEPHLGHAYTTIATDVLARHMRQRGEDVFFLTGTDEHGEPVAQVAERLGVTPRELADRNSERFRDLVRRVDATSDFFIRTSDPEHVAAVQEVLGRVYEKGHVYSGTYEGFYCPRCADFKTDAELLEGDRCPIHKIVLEREREDNWFFRLSAFQEPLERLFAERPDFVLPAGRYNEALAFIRGGLNDISLTRSRISWGVPVPWDDRQVFYVWFDALLNYYTALTYAAPSENLVGSLLAADRPRDGQGHPQVPLGVLAGPADGGRHRAAAAPVRPRLPAHGRGEDVEVAGERDRPLRGHRPLRHRRPALLPDARGVVRAGRLGLARGLRDPLHHGARQRVRQPGQPHARHDRPLPRGPRARGRAGG
ncbi:MAG: methionine--tRNA ligase [Thermoleophilaceae bacterium]